MRGTGRDAQPGRLQRRSCQSCRKGELSGALRGGSSGKAEDKPDDQSEKEFLHGEGGHLGGVCGPVEPGVRICDRRER